MPNPKRIHTSRPRDRSFEAYVIWLDALVVRFIPRAPRTVLDGHMRDNAELSWRNFWATIDRNESVNGMGQ